MTLGLGSKIALVTGGGGHRSRRCAALCRAIRRQGFAETPLDRRRFLYKRL